MGQSVRRPAIRRWLASAGAVAVVGTAVLSGGGAASAAPSARGTLGQAAAPAQTVASVQAAGYRPTRHIIYYGETGGVVKRLQERLRHLHYYPGVVDGKFGQSTLEAVWAFKEVQGLKTTSHPNNVGHGMQRVLVHPRLPRVLKPHGGSHRRIEVNQNKQVLVLYHHNKVELISHVSTGGRYYFCEPHGGSCGYAITPDGNYRARWFAHGWLTVPLGKMYDPVFFIGGSYAIHGDVPVPLQAVSHGCVRIPMDVAYFFHKLINISEQPGKGTPIYIRGRA
jgi:lipoprotein-anchoring transpeptidase ErfK/SrfK